MASRGYTYKYRKNRLRVKGVTRLGCNGVDGSGLEPLFRHPQSTGIACWRRPLLPLTAFGQLVRLLVYGIPNEVGG